MNDNKYIAERKMRAIDKDGNELNIVVGLGAPFPREDIDAWDCPVKVDGLYKKLANSTGIDSWQSLQLSRNLVVQLLSSFIEDGGKLFVFNDSDEVKLDELHEFF